MPLRDASWVTEELGLPSVYRTYDLARRKVIPSVRVGRRVMFSEAAIARFVRNGGASEPRAWGGGEESLDDHESSVIGER